MNSHANENWHGPYIVIINITCITHLLLIIIILLQLFYSTIIPVLTEQYYSVTQKSTNVCLAITMTYIQ